MSLSRPKLTSLESTRGLAAMAIVAFHLLVIYTPLPDGALSSFVGALSGSVPIFFALSAFSLLYGYQSTLFSREGLIRFFTRRAFRILPLFYFMLFVYFCRAAWGDVFVSKSELLLNFAFLFPFIPGKHESLVWAGWSLGVEWLFYLAFPIVALTATRLRLSFFLMLAFALMSVAMSRAVLDANLPSSYKSMNFPANLLYFQAGVLAYAWVAHGRSAPSRFTDAVVARAAAGTALAALAAWFAVTRVLGLLQVSQPPVQLLTACLALAVVVLAFGGLPRAVDNRWSQKLGRYSYGIYLLHPFFLWLLASLGAYRWLSHVLVDPTLVFFAALALNYLVLVPTAALCFHAIERPGMRMGEALLARRGARALA